MNVKLTLKLDEDVIDRAKVYAKAHRTSLSKLVKNYFESLTGEKKDSGQETSPLVTELSGVIELPENFDLEKEYTEYLDEKYK